MTVAVYILLSLLMLGVLALTVVRLREQNRIRRSLEDYKASHNRFMSLLGQLEGAVQRPEPRCPDSTPFAKPETSATGR